MHVGLVDLEHRHLHETNGRLEPVRIRKRVEHLATRISDGLLPLVPGDRGDVPAIPPVGGLVLVDDVPEPVLSTYSNFSLAKYSSNCFFSSL